MSMRIMVYKRTHTGDPNKEGEFGCFDCMGSKRNNNYDAVIGIGCSGPWKGLDISCKITWVGIGPKKGEIDQNHKGPTVTFEHFVLMDNEGPLAPESLHPDKLPRLIILTEGRKDHEQSYIDAKRIIDQAMSGEIASKTINQTNVQESTKKICKDCRK